MKTSSVRHKRPNPLRFAYIFVACTAALAGCSHNRITDFRPDEGIRSAIIFGDLKIYRNGVDATKNARVTFGDGQTFTLDHNGFIAVHTYPGQLPIINVNIDGSSVDYKIPNLMLRSGPAGTKTYFGNISMVIYVPPIGASDMSERWTWKVHDHWQYAWREWNRRFGRDKHKFYSGLAERTGPDLFQTRALATDRQAVETGF